MTAGIYCGRARLKTLLIEKSLVGGLATYTNEIENYPGFPEGQSGLDLMNLFHQQAKKFGVTFKLTDVKSVSLEGDTKVVETFRNRYECSAVIVASGGKPRLTGARNEEKYLYDKGISFCATCDAAANTGKTVVVIGSGDAAIEEGMFLTKFADKVLVSVMHDVGIMDCNEIAKGQAMDNPKMEFLWNTVPDSFEGEDHLETVVLKNLKTGQLEPITADTCFLFIGYLPNTELFQGILDMSPANYLKTNERMETNIPGVWAVGDVRDKFLKQVATAVGDGAVAGYGAEKYIAKSEMFESQILHAEKPTLVYLFSAVDPDARELLTYIEQLEAEISPRLSVAKVDIYKSDGIARRLGISQFPAVALVENGRIVKTMTEHVNEDSIHAFIG